MAMLMCFSVVGCTTPDDGDGGDNPPPVVNPDNPNPNPGTGRPPKKKSISFYYENGSAMSYQESIKKVATYWNENYAETEGFEVRPTPNNSSNLNTVLLGTSNCPDLVEINDKYSQKIITSNVLEPLDTLINGKIDLSKIGDNLTSRYLSGSEKVGNVTKYSPKADNAALYAIPGSVSPCVLYYNTTLFTNAGIKIISVAEEDLAAYNQANGTSYLPHGYYVYETDPSNGGNAQSTTKNEIVSIDGTSQAVTGYRVFNNLIPMNWEEFLGISSLFTKAYNSGSSTTVGVASEYWFFLGWSVGGDCLAYDADKGGLTFSLLDETPGFMALDNITIEDSDLEIETAYKAGDLLDYNERKIALSSYEDEIYDATNNPDGKLYQLPSMYETMTYFSGLTMNTNMDVDKAGGIKGYGVALDSTRLNNGTYLNGLTTSQIAMLYIGWAESSKIGTGSIDWNVAPAPQYREYNADGSIKVVNGVEVKGYKANQSTDNAWAIPKNSANKNEAAKFLAFLCTEEAQMIMAESGYYVTNNSELATKESYKNVFKSGITKSNINYQAVLDAADVATPGDWCYTNDDGNWVNIWAVAYNGEVRTSKKTMQQLFEQTKNSAGQSIIEQTNAAISNLPYIGIVSHNTHK
jgi:ABC-type glycerol-3-phosphate transport system substrate-binding protein